MHRIPKKLHGRSGAAFFQAEGEPASAVKPPKIYRVIPTIFLAQMVWVGSVLLGGHNGKRTVCTWIAMCPGLGIALRFGLFDVGTGYSSDAINARLT